MPIKSNTIGAPAITLESTAERRSVVQPRLDAPVGINFSLVRILNEDKKFKVMSIPLLTALTIGNNTGMLLDVVPGKFCLFLKYSLNVHDIISSSVLSNISWSF